MNQTLIPLTQPPAVSSKHLAPVWLKRLLLAFVYRVLHYWQEAIIDIQNGNLEMGSERVARRSELYLQRYLAFALVPDYSVG